MAASVTLNVQLQADSIRLLMSIPRDMLEGRIELPPGTAVNRRAMLESAVQTSKVLRTIVLGMKSIDDVAAFSQLRDEVADFGIWAEAQLKALNDADGE